MHDYRSSQQRAPHQVLIVGNSSVLDAEIIISYTVDAQIIGIPLRINSLL